MSRFGPYVPAVGGAATSGPAPATAAGGPEGGGGHAQSGSAGRIAELVAQLVAALAADPELAARIHAAADSDASPQALHHTLGEGNTQAATGSHLHDARYSQTTHTHDLDTLTDLAKSWSNAVSSATTTQSAETKDAGTVEFVAHAGRRYLFRYSARINSSAATEVDLRVRGATYTSGVPLLSVADTLLGAQSVSTPAGGAGGHQGGHCLFSLECPGELAAGNWTIAGFWDTTGTGTSLVDQPTGGRRQLEVIELLQAD